MRADALRNRKRLLAVAERLFTTKGSAVEMDEIAAAAGVGVGTIYRHFATKDDLVRAVFAEVFEALIDEATTAAAAPEPGPAFFRFFTSFVERAAVKHHLAEAFSRGEHAAKNEAADPAAARAVEAKRQRFRVAFEALLERAQYAGAVRKDVRLPELLALVNGAFPYLRRYGNDREEHARLFKLVVGALATKPARGRRERKAPVGARGVVVSRIAAKRAARAARAPRRRRRG